MNRNVKGIIVEIGGDTSGLKKALEGIEKISSSLTKELKNINSLLKLDPKNTILLEQKQQALNKEISNTESELKGLKIAQQEAEDAARSGVKVSQENYEALQRKIIETENKLKRLKAEASNWNKAGQALVDYGDKLNNLSQKLDKVGNALTTKLTLPIVALTGTVIKSASDFESAYAGVKKTVEGTPEQLEEIKKGIKDIAEVVPSTTEEIAGVAEIAGQLGVETDNVIGFSKAMIDLSNSTNLDTEEGSAQLAKFENIMGTAQDKTENLGSALVDLGNHYATTEKDIMNMSMRLAGAGKQVGLSEGDVLGLATGLSSVGVEAEMGGSAFSKAMVKMQSAVEVGGSKLDNVLKTTKMSLRDLQLMSDNDTKSFKELAGELGMTKTELKNMVTAGAQLRDFAKISGMTTEEFKKQWKKDATGAITAFIKGLGNTKKQGKSAIAMLQDMGLSEVRLRDSLLRAANSGNLFSKAIKTGNKAFKENTALSKEANQRYETLASRTKVTTNKLKNLATNMGEKLTPTAKEFLEKVDGLIDGFDELSDEQVQTIAKIGLLVAAVGPAIKILSKLTGTVGSGVTSLGNLFKAVANVKNGITTAEGQVGTFTTVLTNLKSPTVLTTAAVVALTAATVALAKKHQESITGLNGLREKVNEQTEAWNKLKQARKENFETYTNEIAQEQKLANELDIIVDKNGKVKKGYETRAKYITEKLSESLGTEIKLNGNVIEQYDKIKEKVNELILAKKAEALLNVYQSEYETALKNEAEATKTLIDLRQQQTEKTKELVGANAQQRYEINQTLSTLATNIQKQTSLIGEYGYTIQNYEDLQTASVSGSAEKIEEAVDKMGVSWEQAKKQAGESIEDQLLNQALYVEGIKTSLEDAEKFNDTYQANVLRNQKTTAEKQLKELEENLTKQTSTIENLSDDEIKTWKALAQGSFNTYKEVLSKLPNETVDKIQKATDVVAIDTSLRTATSDLADDATQGFFINLTLQDSMKERLKSTSDEIDKDSSVEESSKELAKSAKESFENNTEATTWGNDLTDQVSSGMTSSSSKNKITSAASKVAGWIENILGFSLPETGPLSDFDKSMPDMIDLMVKGINLNKSKLNKSIENMANEINQKMQTLTNAQGKIHTGVIDATKTVFTTPQITFNVQKMDEENLNECFNYINKKFGSKY